MYYKGEKTMRTGIIRRIDDLGRIIIPKDIRRQLCMKENDPLEMGICGKALVLEKYQPLQTLGLIAKPYLNAFGKVTGMKLAVCDRHEVLDCFGFDMPEDTQLCDEVEFNIVNNYELFKRSENKNISVKLAHEVPGIVHAVVPIIRNGKSVGGLVLLGEDTYEITDSVVTDLRIISQLITDAIGDYE